MSTEVDAFVRTILRSGLLPREQLQAALRAVPADARADVRQIAEHLIREGRLTRFQAQKLLQGVSIGLVIGPYQLEAVLGQPLRHRLRERPRRVGEARLGDPWEPGLTQFGVPAEGRALEERRALRN